jgi:putative membrane protein
MKKRLGLTVPLRGATKWALLAGVYSLLPLLIAHFDLVETPRLIGGASAALLFVLALLIGFRVNAAYDRWWEARKLWGTLVNVSRNLAVKVRELQQPNDADRQSVRDLIVAFCLGLKDHLRDEADLSRLPGFEADSSRPIHLPSYVARRLYRVFSGWQAAGELSDERLWVLDSETRILLDVCGACERIKTTLPSVSWRFFTRQSILAVLILLPWGLVESFGAWTIVLTILISYVVIAGEAIAGWVEEPFGRGEDHLDLEGICQAIDLSVSEVLTGNS